MQEETVQWNPMMEHRLSWGAKLFVLYLLAVLVISLLKAVSLATQLWRFRSRLPKEASNDSEKAELLAAAAIGARHLAEPVYKALAAGNLAVLKQANNEFHYMWAMSAAKAESIKRISRLTLFLSVLALAQGTIGALKEISMPKIFGPALLAGSASETLELLAMGLFVCAVLYSVFSLFEGTLTRRCARWDYLYESAKSNSPAEQV
jgi:hypothetical protein